MKEQRILSRPMILALVIVTSFFSVQSLSTGNTPPFQNDGRTAAEKIEDESTSNSIRTPDTLDSRPPSKAGISQTPLESSTDFRTTEEISSSTMTLSATGNTKETGVVDVSQRYEDDKPVVQNPGPPKLRIKQSAIETAVRKFLKENPASLTPGQDSQRRLVESLVFRINATIAILALSIVLFYLSIHSVKARVSSTSLANHARDAAGVTFDALLNDQGTKARLRTQTIGSINNWTESDKQALLESLLQEFKKRLGSLDLGFAETKDLRNLQFKVEKLFAHISEIERHLEEQTRATGSPVQPNAKAFTVGVQNANADTSRISDTPSLASEVKPLSTGEVDRIEEQYLKIEMDLKSLYPLLYHRETGRFRFGYLKREKRYIETVAKYQEKVKGAPEFHSHYQAMHDTLLGVYQVLDDFIKETGHTNDEFEAKFYRRELSGDALGIVMLQIESQGEEIKRMHEKDHSLRSDSESLTKRFNVIMKVHHHFDVLLMRNSFGSTREINDYVEALDSLRKFYVARLRDEMNLEHHQIRIGDSRDLHERFVEVVATNRTPDYRAGVITGIIQECYVSTRNGNIEIKAQVEVNRA